LSNVLDEDNFLEPCDGLKKDIGHGEYGFCQAGISSAISEVKFYQIDEVLIAAVGVIYVVLTYLNWLILIVDLYTTL